MMGGDLGEIKTCPVCGRPVLWDDMIWLSGRCTCPDCYEKLKAEEEIKNANRA